MSDRHNYTDEELIMLYKEKDVVAFREIYVRYWYELYLIINKRLRSKEASEEIIQNFFTIFFFARLNVPVNLGMLLWSMLQMRWSVYKRRETTVQSNLQAKTDL